MQDSSTERVGRYQLLEPIGGGPNGSVSRAKVFGVAGFERQFAIKRFLPELAAAPSSAQALSAAARSYGSLEHPRIARMSEFGVAQGQTFTAVELVAGLDVQRLVAESRLGGGAIPAGGSLALISQAARAVGYAHGRGLSHLGLSPTNVIVTAEGDVKVTDFGILAAAIPAKPVDAPRLAPRIGYLAPEQLVGEATSAATDVFVLGVIAYELVTGQRAFFGDTPQAIANAILAGPPADPPLPRPIVRVLSRCLARSQFERFPDARAFADALDAALRVAPVPGTRKDVGALVKAMLDRHAAMNEGNLSGVVALNLGPRPRHDEPEGGATTPFVRPDVEVARPARLVGPRSESARTDVSPTVPSMPKPLTTTMPGMAAPPPIPSPGAPPAIPAPGANKTIMGLAKPQIPQLKPKSPIPSVMPPALRPIAGLPSVPPGARPLSGPIPMLRQTQPGAGPPPTPPTARAEDPAAAPAVESPAVPSAPIELDEFGRPRAKLIGPLPGLGAPGRPPSNPGVTRPGSELAIELEADVATLEGGDFDGLTDVPTRPGELHRAESDFSDLSQPDPASTLPDAQVARIKRDTLGDDPPTAPHDVLPEVHSRGGLKPFVPSFAASEPTNTSPSIEIIREPDSQDLEPSRSKRPSNMPTSEMTREQVQELKRAALGDDPLVELAIEAHTIGAIEVHEGNQVNLAARARSPSPNPSALARSPSPSPSPSPNPSATLFGVGRAGDPQPPPRQRMPSPSPPSLQPLGMTPPEVRVGSAPNVTSGLATGPTPVPGTVQSLSPPPPRPLGAPPMFQTVGPPALKKRRWPLGIAALVVVGAGAGVVTWQVMQHGDEGGATTGSNGSAISSGHVATGSGFRSGSGSASVVTNGSGHGSAIVTAIGSGHGSGSASVAAIGSGHGSGSAIVAMVPKDAGVDAAMTGSAAKPTPTGTPVGDALQIASTPGGARVFIDGADQGVTPVKMSGSADRHTMALFLAGHDLYVAEVDGHGAFSVALKPITPSGGPAGIKVIKCKDKDRYYVFVDGKPTGMACPTERIECATGPHTVEVYDLVTETRRKWDITVTDTRLSYRVRVD
ncbi:MAG TPA: protein kinase [Kofleriaceae bacterium]|nr:protein kinase [Kofleriaceae bacterium]